MMQSYRDALARKGIEPLVIERTDKRPGDLVLSSWTRPAHVLPAHYRNRSADGKFRRVGA